MPELLLDRDETQTQWVRPDDKGFTLRTQYHGTQSVLDQNARERTGKRHRSTLTGSAMQPAARFPLELYEQLTLAMGREPTADELLVLSQTSEYKALRLTDKRLV
jgi:hypothetical protein